MAVPEACVTTAVNVTLVPLTAVVADVVSAVLVPIGAAADTTTVTAEEVLPLKFASPP
jgi:hypothetical protein